MCNRKNGVAFQRKLMGLQIELLLIFEDLTSLIIVVPDNILLLFCIWPLYQAFLGLPCQVFNLAKNLPTLSLDFDPGMELDLDPHIMNADPKH
jgi:hypothetical protein